MVDRCVIIVDIWRYYITSKGYFRNFLSITITFTLTGELYCCYGQKS